MDCSKDKKIEEIAHHFGKIMEVLGLDLTHPDLAKTPQRVAKMYVEELFTGLDPENFPAMTSFDVPSSGEEHAVVVVKDIAVKSMCEHHFVPIIGQATVAYIPRKRILGLSKIHRLVDYFCRRPQLQEKLTLNIAETLSRLLDTEDVAVIIEAEHHCVTFRGVENEKSKMRTHILLGSFKKTVPNCLLELERHAAL